MTGSYELYGSSLNTLGCREKFVLPKSRKENNTKFDDRASMIAVEETETSKALYKIAFPYNRFTYRAHDRTNSDSCWFELTPLNRLNK